MTEKGGGGLFLREYGIHYTYLTSMHSPKEIWRQILSALFVSALVLLRDCPYTIEIIEEEGNIPNIISDDQEEGVTHVQVQYVVPMSYQHML